MKLNYAIDQGVLSARRSPRGYLIGAIVIALAVCGWGAHHALSTIDAINGNPVNQFKWVYTYTFVFLLFQMALCLMERVPGGAWGMGKRVAVLVPAYNEDPQVLVNTLKSLFRSDRLPDYISVTDDGTSKADYTEVRKWFEATAKQYNIVPLWTRTPNRKKRHAQVVSYQALRDANLPIDIVVTVDSDAILDSRALSQLLAAFRSKVVQSACGIVLAANNRATLLARITDVLFVTNQLTDRSSMSAVGNVLVNSGVLAAYRNEVVEKAVKGNYLEEQYRGRRVEFSDDSFLTLIALTMDKMSQTVQVPSAFVFTMMPQDAPHHFSQQTRWMRGSFIRSLWRLRYLPATSFGYWRQVMGLVQLAVTTAVLLILCVVQPIVDHIFAWQLVLVPIAVAYGQSLRYLSYRRSDLSMGAHLGLYALAPLSLLWSMFVLRPMRFWCIATAHRKTDDWHTRADIEVFADRTSTKPIPLRPGTGHTQTVALPPKDGAQDGSVS